MKNNFLTFRTAVITLLLSIGILGNISLVMAGETDTTGMRSFNVGTYLSFGKDQKAMGVEGQQNQSYLKSGNPLASFILEIVNFIALTVGSVCFVSIVYAGFLMLTSAGNANQVNKGKDIITHAVIGLILTLSAYYLVAFVQSILFEAPK
jgi:hypothetical protein